MVPTDNLHAIDVFEIKLWMFNITHNFRVEREAVYLINICIEDALVSLLTLKLVRYSCQFIEEQKTQFCVHFGFTNLLKLDCIKSLRLIKAAFRENLA